MAFKYVGRIDDPSVVRAVDGEPQLGHVLMGSFGDFNTSTYKEYDGQPPEGYTTENHYSKCIDALAAILDRALVELTVAGTPLTDAEEASIFEIIQPVRNALERDRYGAARVLLDNFTYPGNSGTYKQELLDTIDAYSGA